MRGVDKITKQKILEKISQITIFSRYLNIPDTVIKDCIENNTLIKSPLRYDNNPTCGFRYDNNGKLKFKDFAGYFWGDCFDVVALIMSEMYKTTIDISNKYDFMKVLQHITYICKDIYFKGEVDHNYIDTYIKKTIKVIKNRKSIIEIVVRNWNEKDIKYWSKRNIELNDLNLNFIYPIDQYFIDREYNPYPKYFYNEKDPCYAYYTGQYRNIKHFKLYFPFRDKHNLKFISNYNHLEGIYNLNEIDYDIIVITKSTKDRIVLNKSIKGFMHTPPYGGNAFKIGVINIPHETYLLKQNEYDWLSSKLSKNGIIVSLMDNDITGKNHSKKLEEHFNIKGLIIPSYLKCKDFDELVIKYDKPFINNIIENTLKLIERYINGKDDKLFWNTETSNVIPY